MSLHLLRAAPPPCPLHVRGCNRLLSLLDRPEYDRLRPSMDLLHAKRGEALFDIDQPIAYAYFPLTAIASLVIALDDGGTVEVATVGNEGFAGVPLLLDADRSPTRGFIQVGGDYLRMTAAAFTSEVRANTAFAAATRRYAQGFLNQVSQSTACNRFHPIEQRLCRWILMTHDRLGGDHLPLTQEFIAMMLGVRRASVAVAAGALQRAGMIRYRRGAIDIVDREQLEEGACECYASIAREYVRLLC